MAKNIFPTQKQDQFEKLANLATINYEAVEKKLTVADESEAPVIKTSSKKPVRTSMTKQASKQKKIASVEELFLSGDEDHVRIPTAAYLEACVEAGDEENWRKAMALRSQFRAAMMQYAEKEDEEEELGDLLECGCKDGECKCEEDKEDKEEKKGKKGKKELPEALKAHQFKPKDKKDDKEVVAARLRHLGLPAKVADAYVDAMYDTQVPEFVEKLAASDLDKEAKTSIFKSMIKEATLEEKDKNRLLDYWKNELGYQDKEWCDDIVEDVDPVTGAK